MIQTSESIKAISAALYAFQGKVGGVKRDAANPHFKSRYATLEAVIDTARPVLQSVGIVFMQSPGSVVDGALEVATTLIHHESGEWIRSTMQMPLGKRDPQGAGSAMTYAMRYSLMATLGLPPTDDDGEAAMERGGNGNGHSPISETQAKQIRALIEATGTDAERFCEYLGVEDIPHIPVVAFERAVAALEKKKRVQQ